WPNRKSPFASAAIDSNRQLWVVISGEASATLAPESIRSFRALRDSAPFDVEFASLGPRVSLGAKTFRSLGSLAKTVGNGDLVFFVGPNDRIDANLAQALVLESAWDRDFVLTDQFYVDGARVAPLLFHGSDHYHLAHV